MLSPIKLTEGTERAMATPGKTNLGAACSQSALGLDVVALSDGDDRRGHHLGDEDDREQDAREREENVHQPIGTQSGQRPKYLATTPR
jgi:hypothetical protein